MAVASASWQVEFDLFRGPLHTLLDLIERRELPVTRISLVQVADQFLALVQRSPALDLDLVAEFLHVAARLLWLKSLALLPHADAEPPPQEVEDDLQARLLTYRRFRDAARLLAARQDASARMFGRPAPIDVPVVRPVHLEVEPLRVRRAARRALERAAARRQATSAAPSPLIPFTEVLHAVAERLRGRRHIRFRDLVAEADDLIVAITMFLAVLELVRQRRLALRQQEAFGAIELLAEDHPAHDGLQPEPGWPS
jgi:segregation and condensation protein A